MHQYHKANTIGTLSLLQPLAIPRHTWTDISMDFIEGLPKSYTKSIIMVVVYRISKYAHYCNLAHPFKAINVAQLFLDNIFKLHGIPSFVVNDHDPIFTSNFWLELFKLQGNKINIISSYKPQMDDQIEIIKKYLEIYLCFFTFTQLVHWIKWLPLVEWWYNNSYYTSINPL